MTTIATLGLVLDAGGFIRAADAAGRALDSVEDKATKVGSALSTYVTAPLAAVGAAALANAVRIGNFADELYDASAATGLSVESLQEWQFIATASGDDAGVFADAATKLGLRLKAVGEESEGTQAALDKLGIKTRDASGQFISMDELFPSIVSALQKVENTTARNSLAFEVFGRSATSLAPALAGSADEMERLREQAHDLGLIMGGDALAAADSFREEWAVMSAQLKDVANDIGVALMPIMQELMELIKDHVLPIVTDLADWISSLTDEEKEWIVAIGASVAALGPLLLILGKIVSAAGAAAEGIKFVTAQIVAAGTASGVATPKLAAFGAGLSAIAAIGTAAALAVGLAWDAIKNVGLDNQNIAIEEATKAMEHQRDIRAQLLASGRSLNEVNQEMVRIFGDDLVVALFKTTEATKPVVTIMTDAAKKAADAAAAKKKFDEAAGAVIPLQGIVEVREEFNLLAIEVPKSTGAVLDLADEVSQFVKDMRGAHPLVEWAARQGEAIKDFAAGAKKDLEEFFSFLGEKGAGVAATGVAGLVGGLLMGIADEILSGATSMSEAVAEWKKSWAEVIESIEDWARHELGLDNEFTELQDMIEGRLKQAFDALLDFPGLDPAVWALRGLRGTLEDIDVVKRMLASDSLGAADRRALEEYLKALEDIQAVQDHHIQQLLEEAAAAGELDEALMQLGEAFGTVEDWVKEFIANLVKSIGTPFGDGNDRTPPTTVGGGGRGRLGPLGDDIFFGDGVVGGSDPILRGRSRGPSSDGTGGPTGDGTTTAIGRGRNPFLDYSEIDGGKRGVDELRASSVVNSTIEQADVANGWLAAIHAEVSRHSRLFEAMMRKGIMFEDETSNALLGT